MKIGTIRLKISECTTGVYLRWWFNGWHYFNFTNGYEITQKSESMGTQVTCMFSVVSKIERPTRLKIDYSYKISLEGISAQNIPGFTGLLMAEKVMQYEDSAWREVDITRGNHLIRDNGENGYEINFEITRRELAVYSTVYQRSLRLYVGDTLCDMDLDEVVPINKQTNDIAEMQDRQSDFTASFKIRKTREMRALFELSGETGIKTDFPFVTHECKLIQDNIEVITAGTLTVDNADDQYYYVSILSGNKNFFKTIELLKLPDLSLPSTDHTWDVATMVATHAVDLDYVYPLLEPSADGGMCPVTDDGDRVDLYGGWIWPFIKLKAIWDEIFVNAGYTVEGDILTNPIFLRMFMPVVNRRSPISHISDFSDKIIWTGRRDYASALNLLAGGAGTVLIHGQPSFRDLGYYTVRVTGLHKFRIGLSQAYYDGNPEPGVWVYKLGVAVATLLPSYPGSGIYYGEYAATYGDILRFYIGPWYNCTSYAIAITDIEVSEIALGSIVTPHINLPDISQTEFIKMVCNMFGLIPDVTPRNRVIKFWNYDDLYENIPIARDWSDYLSERDDTNEFKFGEYAQNNYLRYRESEDVQVDKGIGAMQIDDLTLPAEKDVVELPVSTTDEVNILNNIFSVDVSRINFNEYDLDDAAYKSNQSIDPRVVYIDFCRSIASPPYDKTFGISATVGGGTTDITNPKIATSHELWFSSMVVHYGSLSRLLTKTNLRRAKFNLPVYEVAGLKHYIPIYLRQYKAYFYVNKVNNYVPGQLCTIDLIKL